MQAWTSPDAPFVEFSALTNKSLQAVRRAELRLPLCNPDGEHAVPLDGPPELPPFRLVTVRLE